MSFLSTLGDLAVGSLRIGVPQIIFVLVIIFAFAPVLVWAERRQSAMIQDRIGPVRAGIDLPAGIVGPLRTIVMGIAILFAIIAFVQGCVWLFGDEVGEDALSPFSKALVFAGGALVCGGLAKYLAVSQGKVRLLGLLHPLADALKMIWKEDFVPPRADKVLHALAPMVALVPAIMSFAVIPFASNLVPACLGVVAGSPDWTAARCADAIPLQVASLNVGVLFVFAVAGTGIVGAAIAGYSSDNKYSLLGGLRAAGQMVSYEVTLGLTLVPAFMLYGSLLLENMVGWQGDYLWGLIPRWGIFFPTMTFGFVLFFAAAIAETKRIPFDVPEGESELVGGYLTEYSGMKFGMFFMSEFVEVIILSALAVTVFLGGYHVPWLQADGFAIHIPFIQDAGTYFELKLPHWVVIVLQVLSFIIKVLILMWFQLMIRWTLPRFRYDQIMRLCWRNLLPLALLNILATGLLLVAIHAFGAGNWFRS